MLNFRTSILCLSLEDALCMSTAHYETFCFLADFSFEGTHILKQLHCASVSGYAVVADTGWFLSDSTAKREILCIVCIVSICMFC
jgi:hypothetical protein